MLTFFSINTFVERLECSLIEVFRLAIHFPLNLFPECFQFNPDSAMCKFYPNFVKPSAVVPEHPKGEGVAASVTFAFNR